MKFDQIKDLIMIRDYIISYRNDAKADTKTLNYLNSCLNAIDKKIIVILSSEEFKNYVGLSSNQLSEQRLNFNGFI